MKNRGKRMKYLITALLLTTVFASTANAQCRTNQVNGIWQGTFIYPNIGFMGVCTVWIKGRRLLADSACTDDTGEYRALTQSRVSLDKDICVLEISFRTIGQDVFGSFTVDRQETVLTGMIFQEALRETGVATMVKKAPL